MQNAKCNIVFPLIFTRSEVSEAPSITFTVLRKYNTKERDCQGGKGDFFIFLPEVTEVTIRTNLIHRYEVPLSHRGSVTTRL